MSTHLILLRHAERPNIPNDEVGNDVSLTKQGIQQTKLFAKSLKQPIISIASSPILRCVQTAEIISNHCGYNKTIKKTKLLGDPGFFIEDPELAWTHWQTKGHKAVNQHLLSGKECWDGFYPFDSATNHMKEKIIEQVKIKKSGVHL